MNTLVSISCITFNHSKFITECLDSFLMQQTSFNFEVLIHDDASTDGTQEIIKAYQAKYPNIIKPIFQTENQYSQGKRGINAKYNYSRAQGKYIALCEGDDYWTDPLKLQKQVDFLEANPKCILTYHAWIEKHGEKFQEPKKMFSSTHTIMFRNIIDKFQDHLNIPVLNGDTLLKFLLLHYGKECFVEGIEPAVKHRDSGGVWNSLSYQKQEKSKLHTSQLMLKELRGTKFENRAKTKFVNTLISSNRHLRARNIEHLSANKEISLALKYGVFFKYSWSKLAYLKNNLINGN